MSTFDLFASGASVGIIVVVIMGVVFVVCVSMFKLTDWWFRRAFRRKWGKDPW